MSRADCLDRPPTAREWIDRVVEGLALLFFFNPRPEDEQRALDAFDEIRALSREADGCERGEVMGRLQTFGKIMYMFGICGDLQSATRDFPEGEKAGLRTVAECRSARVYTCEWPLRLRAAAAKMDSVGIA